MTHSIVLKALIFTQAAEREVEYGASRRFATIPSMPCSCAALNNATPVPTNCSERLIAPIGVRISSRSRWRSRSGCFVRSFPSTHRTSNTSYTTGVLLRSFRTVASSRTCMRGCSFWNDGAPRSSSATISPSRIA